jgi:transcriptional regulator with XRE-family HTH domain
MTKQTWQEALSSSDEGRKLIEQERLLLEATEAISRVMDAQGVSRAELARKLQRTPAFVTKLLQGDNNFTLRTLSDVFFELGRSVHLELGQIGDAARVPDGDAFRVAFEAIRCAFYPVAAQGIDLSRTSRKIVDPSNNNYALAV